MRPDFDMRNVGILEESVTNNLNSDNLDATAHITKYTNNSVTIQSGQNHGAL